MDNKSTKFIYGDITEKIISAIYDVFHKLGFGHPEKFYHRALEKEFIKRDLKFVIECYGKILYDGEIIGRYYLDFLVEDKIAVELKVRRELYDTDWIQLLNYIKAKDLRVGILAVFTKIKPEIKRVVN